MAWGQKPFDAQPANVSDELANGKVAAISKLPFSLPSVFQTQSDPNSCQQFGTSMASWHPPSKTEGHGTCPPACNQLLAKFWDP
jgi:hypothetical protein